MNADLGAVTLADVVRYSGASGDRNPIHYDPEFAQGAGYDGLFAMGALHGSWLISWALTAGATVPEEGPSSVRLRFHRIVPLGVRITAAIEPTETGHKATLLVGDRVCVTAHLDVADPPVAGSGTHEQRIRFPIEEGAARAFAAAVRWRGDVDHAGAAVPPTFLAAMSFWLPEADPIARVGFSPERTLLGETAIELADGPLRVGGTFDVREYVGEERVRVGSAGELRLVDLVAELHDGVRLRASYRNTFVLTPEPAIQPSETSPGRLRGSRDPQTGATYFPERALSVDGALRELVTVDLPDRGVLHSWTSFDGVDFGQVDLDDGVRLQVRLGDGPHQIGTAYTLSGDLTSDWWFARA